MENKHASPKAAGRCIHFMDQKVWSFDSERVLAHPSSNMQRSGASRAVRGHRHMLPAA